MPSSPIPAARSQYLLDLLAQVPDPRKRRGRRPALAGLLSVGIAAIGQRAADACPDVLATRGRAALDDANQRCSRARARERV